MPPRKNGDQRSMLPEVLSAGGQSLDDLRSEAATCEACDLYKLGTQTVFGEGPADADLMLMGEVPGDQEDKAGHPFVGPAGRVLDNGPRPWRCRRVADGCKPRSTCSSPR